MGNEASSSKTSNQKPSYPTSGNSYPTQSTAAAVAPGNLPTYDQSMGHGAGPPGPNTPGLAQPINEKSGMPGPNANSVYPNLAGQQNPQVVAGAPGYGAPMGQMPTQPYPGQPYPGQPYPTAGVAGYPGQDAPVGPGTVYAQPTPANVTNAYSVSMQQLPPQQAKFDSGARFNNGAQARIPPPPPGVAANSAQVAASHGQGVNVDQKKAGFFSGGDGGGVSVMGGGLF